MKPLCALYLPRLNKSSNYVFLLFPLSFFAPPSIPSLPSCAQQRETFPDRERAAQLQLPQSVAGRGFEGLHDSAGWLAVPPNGRYLMRAELIVLA